MQWSWKKFSELTVDELYAILALRERVFIVEQNCAYLDADGMDPAATHLLQLSNGKLLGYLRVLPPHTRFTDVSFGRIVVAPEARGRGNGITLTKEALTHIEATFGKCAVRISAQAHLEKFYERFGFLRVGENYLEDGIPHAEMLRTALASNIRYQNQ